MNVSQIADLARDQTNTNVSQISDDTFVKYLNFVKNDFYSAMITEIGDNYGWDYWIPDWWLIAGQNEYAFPSIASDETWALKVKWVSICYDWKTYDDWSLIYIKAKERGADSLKEDIGYYEQEASFERPFFMVADKSIFIYPKPKESVANWIRLIGIRNIPDYTINTTEEQMYIQPQFHEILLQGTLPYIYRKQRNQQDAQLEKQEYERQKKNTILKMAERVQSPFMANYPHNEQHTTNTLEQL